MVIGLLMLVVPITIYIASFHFARKLKPRICLLYRIVGGLVVFCGSSVSLYFAAYTGDQGGVGAYLFQIAVIVVYIVFSVIILITNYFFLKRDQSTHSN